MVRLSLRVKRGPLAIVLLMQVGLAACDPVNIPSAGPSEPAQEFQRPAAWPGPPWSFQGHPVDWHVVETSAGSSHCAMDQAVFMFISWPPGTYAAGGSSEREYVRDPNHTILDWQRYLKSTVDLDAHLPSAAQPTGLTLGRLRLYIGPDADQAIYVVGKNTTERWQRSDPPLMCM